MGSENDAATVLEFFKTRTEYYPKEKKSPGMVKKGKHPHVMTQAQRSQVRRLQCRRGKVDADTVVALFLVPAVASEAVTNAKCGGIRRKPRSHADSVGTAGYHAGIGGHSTGELLPPVRQFFAVTDNLIYLTLHAVNPT